jgi:5-methylcytosine-specific restriction endonuclease McrA
MGSCLSAKIKPLDPKSTAKINKNPIRKQIVKYHKKSIPKALKKIVWDTYVGENIGVTKCMCCKHQNIRQIEFHCGHVIAEVNGGKTTLENLRPICAQCNLSMGRKNMDDFISTYMKN